MQTPLIFWIGDISHMISLNMAIVEFREWCWEYRMEKFWWVTASWKILVNTCCCCEYGIKWFKQLHKYLLRNRLQKKKEHWANSEGSGYVLRRAETSSFWEWYFWSMVGDACYGTCEECIVRVFSRQHPQFDLTSLKNKRVALWAKTTKSILIY